MLFEEDFLRKLERLSVMSRRAMSGQIQGERRSPKRGQSVEFADFRPYVPGDDIRRIDWNAYARLERFFLKLFMEEEDLTVHILVDTSQSMNWGQPNKLDYALQVAGALGYITLAGLDRVTVTIIGNGNPDIFPPHRGKQSAASLFTFLEMHLPADSSTPLPPSSPNPLGLALHSYAACTQNPGPAIILSDLLEPIHQSANPLFHKSPFDALVAKGFEVTLLHILSPEEINPDLIGDLKLIDSENGAEVEITADYDFLERYRSGFGAWQAELRNFCGVRGMNYIPLETTLPLEELLFAWMRQYSVLK
jgi:hypothetical protein